VRNDLKVKWSERVKDLENRVSEMKREASKDLPSPPVGCHPIVLGLLAIEGMAWGLYDAISHFPSEEEIKRDADNKLI
jgi:hypothetical protein